MLKKKYTVLIWLFNYCLVSFLIIYTLITTVKVIF